MSISSGFKPCSLFSLIKTVHQGVIASFFWEIFNTLPSSRPKDFSLWLSSITLTSSFFKKSLSTFPYTNSSFKKSKSFRSRFSLMIFRGYPLFLKIMAERCGPKYGGHSVKAFASVSREFLHRHVDLLEEEN